MEVNSIKVIQKVSAQKDCHQLPLNSLNCQSNQVEMWKDHSKDKQPFGSGSGQEHPHDHDKKTSDEQGKQGACNHGMSQKDFFKKYEEEKYKNSKK